jgi:predicted outer membrane repeat protein
MRPATTPLSVLIAVLLCASARAAIVTTSADNVPGSLRDAIASAAPGETITFASTIGNTITLTNGELVIDKPLIISGPGAANLLIRRSPAANTPSFRIFNLSPSLAATISGLTLSNGRDDVGGAIFSSGDLTLNDCVITNNVATESGGGIYSMSSMSISNCVIAGNSVAGGSSDGFGGGFYNLATATAINCTITNNSVTSATADAYGGGLCNDGTLTLTSSLVSSNSATGGSDKGDAFGGGIDNGFGTLYLVTSTVKGNVARGGAGSEGGIGEAGGVANDYGTVMLDRSTVSGNSAVGGNGDIGGAGEGGGVSNDYGSVYLDNSTVSGNVANAGSGTTKPGSAYGGGCLNLNGSFVAVSSTITANVVPGGLPDDGGGLFNFAGSVDLKNTILTANSATVDLVNDDLGDTYSYGHNRVGTASGSIVQMGVGDQFNVSAAALRLGPLQNNGGPTFTHALLCGSTALDAGDNTDAADTDQRGLARIVGGVIDIGAYEASNTAPTITCPAPITLNCAPPTGQSVTLSVNVADAEGDPLVVVWTVDRTAYQTNAVAAGGPPTAQSIDFTANFEVGPHEISVSVSDPSGCPTSCSTTVTVNSGGSAQALTINCPTLPAVSADANCQAVVPNIVDRVAVTACATSGGIGLRQSPPAGTLVGLGTHLITVTATNTTGDRADCTTSFTVKDTTPPTITQCVANQSAVADESCQTSLPSFTAGVVASDCSGPVTVTQTPPAGTTIGLGVTIVTFHVRDAAGNESTCTASFTVTDNKPPHITDCAPNGSASAGPNCQAAVPDFTAAVVAGDCSGPVAITQNPVAGTLLGPGTHTITLTVEDVAGNSTTCTTSFTVIGQNAAIQIVTLTEGTDNDIGPGPHIEAYMGVTWTYLVRNPGCEPLENIIVTDSVADVTPSFQGGDSNLNGRLDPGETWIYNATGTAVYGQYENVGTATGTGITTHTPVTNSNPDHYFGDATPCPKGRFIYKFDSVTGDLIMKFYQSPAPNDNSYGVNAVGWAGGHTFSSLVGSDKAGFLLRDPSGVIKLDFYIDYISIKPGTPSGYGSFGPFAQEGRIVVGTLTTNDLTWDTSLARNFNNLGYFVGGVQTAFTKTNINGADLLLNSPPTTDTISSYRLKTPSPWTRGWDFCDAYFVTIKKAKLDSIGFNRATWKVEPDLVGLHNSPAKPCLPSPISASDLSIGTVKLSSKVVSIAIYDNNKTSDAVMSALRLNWPSANGKLVSVKLGNYTLYSTTALAWSATGVTLGDGGSQPLVSTASYRTISKASSKVLYLTFANSVVTDRSQYSGTASFGSSVDRPILP